MASSITRFDIEKFDGKNDFGLWKIKMCALMVQQGCDAALETLLADMEAGEKAALMKKAYSTLILCLGDRFNHLILDLENIDIEIEDEDQTLMLLTSLASSYENFMETLLYGMESLTMEDVLATLNSRELKKRTKGTNEVGDAYFGEALVVVGNDEMTELVMDSGVHEVYDEKRVWFEVELQGAQGDRKAEVFQVSNDDAVVAQRRLKDKVPGQEGAKGNVTEKKKVKESMEANLGKLLKYNTWSAR
ncbi:hypothetical protein Tco_1151047 [Tanacetum coccineum]